MADPSENLIRPVSLEQFGRTLQTLFAGIEIGFDPFTPGSPFCREYCVDLPAEEDYPVSVKNIGNLWPGNTYIDAWLKAYDEGKSNTPTGKYVDRTIEIFQLGDEFWDFGNAPLDPKFSNTGFNPSDLAPFFRATLDIRRL